MSDGAVGFLDDSQVFVDDVRAAAGDFLTRCGQLSVFTQRDPGKLTSSEDAIGVFRVGTQSWVLALADGVGGAAGGRAAALTTMAALGESLEAAGDEAARLRSAILDGIELANRRVLDLANGAATTVAVAEIGAGYVRSYHVGDSSVMLVGQRGRLKLLTVPHSPVGFAVESGLLEAREAIHHELLHIISNVIGSIDMRIEVGPELAMAERDTLLLASDGLFDNMLGDEIVERIRCGALPQVMAELRGTVARRMRGGVQGLPCKPDDCSMVLFRRHSPLTARAWQSHEPGTQDWVDSPHAAAG